MKKTPAAVPATATGVDEAAAAIAAGSSGAADAGSSRQLCGDMRSDGGVLIRTATV